MRSCNRPGALLALLLCLTASLHAQEQSLGRIHGSVVDEANGHPIEFVNVLLRKVRDSAVVTGKATDRKGAFEMNGIPSGHYFATFGIVGYKEKVTPAFMLGTGREGVDLGEIRLVAKEVSLDEMLVTADKSLYGASIDRKIFNVDADLMSRAGSASELLQNIPSIEVDIDGNVSLRGSSNVLIMLNGRSSPLMKRNSSVVLQQMPASSIDRVEIITNPSARHTPEGSSGIINIVLKKESAAGVNGNLSANAGNQDRYNGNILFNYNPGALNVQASYGIRKDSRNRIVTDERLQTNISLEKIFYSERLDSYARPLSHLASLGIEYRFDAFNTCGLSGNYFGNLFQRTENAEKRLFDVNRLLLTRFDRDRIDDESEKEFGMNAFFRHSFSNEDHTLRLEFNTNRDTEQEDNRYTNRYLLPAGPDTYDNTLIKNSEDNSEVTLEYSDPLTAESQLETGYRGEFSRSDLDFHAANYDAVAEKFVTDATKTNRFLFDQSGHALYATYRHSFGTFGILAGLRGEVFSHTSDLVTRDSTRTTSYVEFYPTLHLSYKMNALTELRLSYGRRTHRPDGDDLNPFPEYRDPRNVTAGNPALLPEFIHSFELSCQYQNEGISLLPAIFYRYTYNRFTSVTRALNDSTLLTTDENLSTDQAGGIELVASADLGDFMELHGNANAFLNQIDASNLGYDRKKSIKTWSGKLTLNVNLGRNTRLQLNGNYTSARLTPQGEQPSSYVINVGFRQELFSKSLSLSLTIADLFKTLRREYTLDTSLLHQSVVNTRDSRIMYLGVVYRFGTQSSRIRDEPLQYDDNL